MEIKTLKTFTVKLTEEEIWEIVKEKIQSEHPNAEIERGNFSVEEKVINTYAINNLESEDIMGFSHINVSGIIRE